jgi:arginase
MKQPHQPRIEIIGAASGHGAPDPRCADAPAALRAAGLLPRLRAAGISATWRATVRPSPANSRLPLTAVAQVCRDLARHAEAAVARGSLPLVLGGDHSCAIGTWKGIAQAIREPLGLIWIDAHMDAHTPETTESGKLHGMPLACLLGHGDETLTGIAGGARLDPRHVCLIGVAVLKRARRRCCAGSACVFSRCAKSDSAGSTLPCAKPANRVRRYCGLWDFGRSRCDRSVEAPGVGSPVRGGLSGKGRRHCAC